MKILLMLIVLISSSVNASEVSIFSDPDESTAGGRMDEALHCRYSRDFLGKEHTSVIFRLRKIYNVHNVMMRNHQASVYVDGRDEALCSLVEELKNKGHSTFKFDPVVYSDNGKLEEEVVYQFENGLVLKSNVTYHLH